MPRALPCRQYKLSSHCSFLCSSFPCGFANHRTGVPLSTSLVVALPLRAFSPPGRPACSLGPQGTSGARHTPFDVESNSLRKFCFLERSFLPASREAQTPPQRFCSNPELGSEQETLAFSEMLGTLENITFLAETHF